VTVVLQQGYICIFWYSINLGGKLVRDKRNMSSVPIPCKIANQFPALPSNKEINENRKERHTEMCIEVI
jgi:hypothetical protein